MTLSGITSQSGGPGNFMVKTYNFQARDEATAKRE